MKNLSHNKNLVVNRIPRNYSFQKETTILNNLKQIIFSLTTNVFTVRIMNT